MQTAHGAAPRWLEILVHSNTCPAILPHARPMPGRASPSCRSSMPVQRERVTPLAVQIVNSPDRTHGLWRPRTRTAVPHPAGQLARREADKTSEHSVRISWEPSGEPSRADAERWPARQRPSASCLTWHGATSAATQPPTEPRSHPRGHDPVRTTRLLTRPAQASLPPATTIPWLGNRTIRYEFA